MWIAPGRTGGGMRFFELSTPKGVEREYNPIFHESCSTHFGVDLYLRSLTLGFTHGYPS